MKNLFEITPDFGDDWNVDNKDKISTETLAEIKKPEKHQLHFGKEKRRGKTMTIVKPFYLNKNDLKILLKELKKRLGTGGTVKENRLEFQGDIHELVHKHLDTLGYRFKK